MGENTRMVAHKDLIQNWITGNYDPDLKSETEGNSMKIVEKTDPELDVDFTAIIGYGHAMYAFKTNGKAVICTGWDGYSVTTSKHYTFIREAVKHSHLEAVEINAEPKSFNSKLTNLLDSEEYEDVLPRSVMKKITAEAV